MVFVIAKELSRLLVDQVRGVYLAGVLRVTLGGVELGFGRQFLIDRKCRVIEGQSALPNHCPTAAGAGASAGLGMSSSQMGDQLAGYSPSFKRRPLPLLPAFVPATATRVVFGCRLTEC